MTESKRINKSAFFERIKYKPHAGQIKFHTSGARFRLANCGRRFGKSTMAARDLEPKLFLPNKTFWIVGPTYDLAEKEFRVIWQDLIIGQQLGKDKRIRRGYSKKQGTMYIEFTPWNTRLEVRSADHPENLVGEALDHVIMSEAAKHKQDTWERFIRPALADKRGGADFPTTPEGYNWYYKLWMLGRDETLPEYESWKFPSWDNHEVYPGGIDDAEITLLRRTMPYESFLQEIGADFGSFSGKIYNDWDSAVHVKNVSFNPAWPNYMAFDWGYTNPLAAIEFQISPDGKVYVWREHYKAYMRVEDHCVFLKRREQPEGYHLDLAFGDAADPEAAITVSQKLVSCIALPEAKTNWREGIELVAGLLKREYGTDEYGGPLYETALFVDFSCINTINEFNNYRAPEGVNGRNAQEMGIKSDDHALDALRYGLVHRIKLGAGSHLSDVIASQAYSYKNPLEKVGTSNGNTYVPQSDNSESGFFTAGVTF